MMTYLLYYIIIVNKDQGSAPVAASVVDRLFSLQNPVDSGVGFGVGDHILGAGDVRERNGVKPTELVLDVAVDRGDVLVFDAENAV